MDTKKSLKHARIKIDGMTCHSCEILIEEKLQTLPGMVKVDVSQRKSTADLYYTNTPQLHEIQKALSDTPYTASLMNGRLSKKEKNSTEVNTMRDYSEIGAVFLIILAVYLIANRLHLIPAVSVGSSMSYGLIFLIGVVAAFSTCIAVTGGLLLAASAKYSQLHPHISGWQKFKPNIYFNIGRVASYTVFGGLIGAVGSLFTVSEQITGFITIAASILMIFVGLRLLKLFPFLTRYQPHLPKSLGRVIQQFGERHTKMMPFLFGVATFVFPCGFTQALQLYVLSKGSLVEGALTMFFFSLGTLPALISVGALSAFTQGKAQRYFLKFAGATVLLLGLANITNGLTLTGLEIPKFPSLGKNGADRQGSAELAPIVNGKQIVTMSVRDLDYTPAVFKIRQGVPVEWRIDGRNANGCARAITSPKLRINSYLSGDDVTVVSFTPLQTGTFPFHCPMGMTTRGAAFIVVPNT